MSDSDILFAAIQKQRWYFFENNDKIIFDNTTGLIWVNLKFFPYKKDGNNPYSIKEAIGLVAQMNLQNWGGYGNWKIPTPYELWIMIEDKSFPYRQGNFWRIKSEYYGWCVNVNGGIKVKDLDFIGAYKGITNDRYADVILCSDALKPPNFVSEPRVILDIFRKNNLFPKFNDIIANRIYSTARTSTRTAAPEKFNPPATFELDFAKYDAAAINQSPIKFYKAVASVADEMLELLQRCEDSAAKVSLPIDSKFIASPYLSPEENKLLEARQNFLVRRFTLCAADAKAQILSFKLQAEEMAANIEEINHGKKSLLELAEIENYPRVSFEFLTENFAQILSDTQEKINFCAENENFVSVILKNFAAWNDDFISFKQNLIPQFQNLCTRNAIQFRAWLNDWQKLRLAIEEKFLPLIDFALKENLRDLTFEILTRLNLYKKSVDSFYLSETNIQRRLDVPENPRKFAQKFIDDLQKIITDCDKVSQKVFLQNWADSLTD